MVLPSAVVWTVGVIGAAVIARLVVREWRRINEELARVRTAPVATPRREAIPRLRRDPLTGIYRPDLR